MRMHWFVVMCRTHGEQRPTRSLVSEQEGSDKVFWNGGPAHCTRGSFLQFEKIKDYGWDDAWPEDFDIDVQYILDFPPEAKPLEDLPDKSIEGILAPDGTFYPCGWGGHSNMARDLLICMGGDDYCDHEGNLLANGYLSIRTSVIGCDRTLKPTDAQVAWLWRAAELNDAEYEDKVWAYLHAMGRGRRSDTTDWTARVPRGVSDGYYIDAANSAWGDSGYDFSECFFYWGREVGESIGCSPTMKEVDWANLEER